MDEIDLLVKEINDAEALQIARRQQLYELLKKRHGFKHVIFQNKMDWSNCWDFNHPVIERNYWSMDQSIKEITKGDPSL